MRNFNTTVYKEAKGRWEWTVAVIDSVKNKVVRLEKGWAKTEEEATEQAEIAKLKLWCNSFDTPSVIFNDEGFFYCNILVNKDVKKEDYHVIHSLKINCRNYYLTIHQV